MNSNLYILFYVFLWVLTFLIYQKRRKYVGASSIILLSYIIYAISSVLLYNSPLYNAYYGELKFWPFIYLYLLLLIANLPALKFYEERIKLQKPSLLLINIFSIVYIISALFRIPDIFANIRQGIFLLLMDSSGGEDLYYSTHDIVRSNIGGISNIFAIIYNIFTDVAILIFFYYITLPKKNKYILLGYFIAIFVSVLSPLSQGLRTGVIMLSFNIIIAYFLFKPLMSDRIKKYVTLIGSIVACFIAVLLISLTISRFANRTEGAGGSTLSYIGQANLNFDVNALNAGGTRNGDRTCNTFKQLLGFDNIPQNIEETRIRYAHMKLDDSRFSTLVGDFVLDFGPILTVLLFCLFSTIVCFKTKARKQTLKFHQLILIYFSMIIPMQGGMYLFYYSYGGNLVILAFAFTYFLFKFDFKYTR